MSVTHADDVKLVHGCSKCDRKFSHLFLLKNHEQSHLPYQQRQFTCKKCLDGKRFPTLNRLKAHEKQVRPNDVTLFSLDFVLLSSFKMSETVFSCCFQFLTGNKKNTNHLHCSRLDSSLDCKQTVSKIVMKCKTF